MQDHAAIAVQTSCSLAPPIKQPLSVFCNFAQTKRNDGENSYTYQYDRLNRAIKVTNLSSPGGSWELSYTYDANGNVSSVVDNYGTRVLSSHNTEKFTDTISWFPGDDSASLEFEYTPLGQVSKIRRYSDNSDNLLVSQSNLQWNDRHWPSEIIHSDGSDNILAYYRYNYDSLSQLVSEERQNGEYLYNYDSIGQVTSVSSTGPIPSEEYSYDATGNRIDSQTMIEPGNIYISNSLFSYQYDALGNLIEKVDRNDGTSSSYQYDHNNQLIQADSYNSEGTLVHTIYYRYDMFGRTMLRGVDADGDESIPAQETHYVHDVDHVWADIDGSGNILTQYLYERGVDNILARNRSAEGTAFYLKDKNGTVRDILDTDGSILNHIEYDSFGTPLVETNVTDSDRFKFTAREYDSDLGLYNYRSRHYDPTVGRYLSRDASGFMGGDLNLYRYVFNAPTQYIDPYGYTAVEYSIASRYKAAKAAAFRCLGNAGNEGFGHRGGHNLRHSTIWRKHALCWAHWANY